MIHIYVAKKGRYEQELYRVLCSREWLGYARPRRWGEPKEFVTTPWNATCPDCLKAIIPKLEADLARVRETRILADAKENDPQG
jgi:hypothetical protein